MRVAPHPSTPSYRLLQGDALTRLRELPDESVHCVVTSPPYFGLRDYRVDGQIGLEDTPQQFITKLVEVFREVRRVLRVDGACWINMGDSYAGSGRGLNGDGTHTVKMGEKQFSHKGTHLDLHDRLVDKGAIGRKWAAPPYGYKQKDLIGIPWWLAFALQKDGWWLRSDIIWHKPNPMPESVTDRPTRSHEYLFLVTKSRHYFYDAEAIKEIALGDAPGNVTHKGRTAYENGDVHMRTKAGLTEVGAVTHRNKRTVWTIALEPFSEAHFAAFPTKLVEPCILAGTSEYGCCSLCRAPWRRLTERVHTFQSGSGRAGHLPKGKYAGSAQTVSGDYDIRMGSVVTTRTVGWQPTCECEAETIPCTVLDPFNGAGTTGLVALRLARNVSVISSPPALITACAPAPVASCTTPLIPLPKLVVAPGTPNRVPAKATSAIDPPPLKRLTAPLTTFPARAFVRNPPTPPLFPIPRLFNPPARLVL